MPEATLRVLLDQNIPLALAGWLRARQPDWEVRHVKEIGLAGRADAELFLWAQMNHAVIITYDEDFADARMFPLGSHHGIVRLRVWPTTEEGTQAALERLFVQVPEADLRGSLVIVDPQKIRLRRAP